ncbi:MAG TPA: 2-oxo-4-hydroxy-4-carboxy-5-ureidoimidazoline decarboxylase [Longimicrobium sp.]|nr:2-oxo-4-hydroxy-4-carboxy-5-ureidoimidazoline decarboxylase [Longimicrobium sp.]
MADGIARLNRLPAHEAEAELLTCCGSRRWAREMAAQRPFADADELMEAADRTWWGLPREDWLEAFRAHPRIGERRAERAQTGREQGWSRGEQAGMDSAADETRRALAEGNRAYEERFGHIYLVCASGRGADELLSILRSRLGNDPETELRVAAEEQRRITRLRLEKLLAMTEEEGRR